MQDYNEYRRAFLLKALAAGVLCATASTQAVASFWGDKPKPIQTGRSFHKIKGSIYVNGDKATINTQVRPGDNVRAGKDSTAMLVVGSDAFLIRANSELQLDEAKPNSRVASGFSLITGALLTVFGKTGHTVKTKHSTIGIRGTGVYLETDAESTYICTCYGTIDISSNNKPDEKETIVSSYHENPRTIYGAPQKGKYIKPASFKNHDDLELAILEALVGREVPFDIKHNYYGPPKRNNY